MGSIPLPALQVRPPDPQPSVLDQYGKALTLQSLMSGQKTQALQQQGLQLENQQRQTAMQDQEAQTKAMQQWDGKDYTQLPSLILKNGGSGSAVFAATQHIQQVKQAASDMAAKDAETNSKNLDTQVKTNDQYRGRIQSIINAPAEQQQQLWENEVSAEEQAGKIKPGTISHTYPGDDKATVLANTLSLGSVLAKEASENVAAQARATTAKTSADTFAAKTDPNSPLYDPSAAYLAKKATAGDADAQSILAQQTKQAGAKAGAEAAAKFPYELQLKQQELAQNPIFAVNPKSGQRALTTVAEAKEQGFTNPVKVTNADIEKETSLNAQLNDLQLNTSRYKAALNVMGSLSKTDAASMTHILSDPNVNSGILNNLGMPAVVSMLEQGSKASDWNSLSPDKQQALIGALRMKNSALLFQKVSTGMGRASKEAMDIEIANMPSPVEGATVGNQKMQAFQENIDQMATRSVKLPWMDQSQDVRGRIEEQAVQDYNKKQADKTGQYKGTPSQDTGKRAYEVGMPVSVGGKSKTVSKVYSDGTFDAQ